MNAQDHNLLDDYFNGLLSPEAERALKERIAEDAEFGQAFALREQMADFPRRAAQRSALAETLRSTGADFFHTAAGGQATAVPGMAVRVNRRRWLAVAASIALLAAAIWFVGSPATQPSYEQYAMHAPLSLTRRGAAEASASEAEAAFNAGKYAEALRALDRLQAEQPDNITASLYRAICLIETGSTREARVLLEPVATGNSAIRAEAQWYIALSYLKEKDPQGCRAALGKIIAGEEHYEQAKSLLEKLE
ncbi:MAG: tetratricopeptide repeat protein [Lewinellaceae bacterium]|nr:tetratricopeptide repeat protein [Lewinellaceae bacterium]